MNKKLLINNPNKMVPICYDEMFKAVFGNREYPNITAYLISVLTGIPYSLLKGKIAFKNTNQKLSRVTDKKADKDVIFIVDLEEPLKINLEMNNRKTFKQEIIERNIYFASNFFGMGLEESEDYTNIKTTIQYNFNLKYVDTINKEKIDEYVLRNKYGHILTEKLKIIHINIEELSKLWYSEARFNYPENYQILCGISALMMCTDKSKFESDIRSVPLDEKIRVDIERIVEEMNYDDQLPERYYDRDEEWDRIKRTCIKSEIKEASKKALELGANQEKVEIAKKMLKLGTISIDDISKATGLSKDEIKSLKIVK
ncbi:MAG: PD-(D/E)XK nuclease family transposase [Tenericutes bacterium]|nr:PD-(D/E)XK nuclease family transposase [Mycoplasmatota bacterium]